MCNSLTLTWGRGLYMRPLPAGLNVPILLRLAWTGCSQHQMWVRPHQYSGTCPSVAMHQHSLCCRRAACSYIATASYVGTSDHVSVGQHWADHAACSVMCSCSEAWGHFFTTPAGSAIWRTVQKHSSVKVAVQLQPCITSPWRGLKLCNLQAAAAPALDTESCDLGLHVLIVQGSHTCVYAAKRRRRQLHVFQPAWLIRRPAHHLS